MTEMNQVSASCHLLSGFCLAYSLNPEDGSDFFLHNISRLFEQTTRRYQYIPEEGTLHNYRCENLKLYSSVTAT
jgi:hypothetical protein